MMGTNQTPRAPYLALLTDYAYRLPQVIYWYESVDIAAICSHLRNVGYTPLLIDYEDPKFFEKLEKFRCVAAVPGTSFCSEYRQIVLAKNWWLAATGVRLIPEFVHLAAYENKLVQAVVSSNFELGIPTSYPVATLEGALRAAAVVGYPAVVKLPGGFASEGVSKVNNEHELRRYFANNSRWSAVGASASKCAVVQEFVGGLDHDWKIILYGKDGCSLRRGIAKGDFRASGSGRFQFAKAPTYLFEHAHYVQTKLNAPWISIDIAGHPQTQKPLVFEYQILHFGMTAVTKSPNYFHRTTAGKWDEIHEPMNVERVMAERIDALVKESCA